MSEEEEEYFNLSDVQLDFKSQLGEESASEDDLSQNTLYGTQSQLSGASMNTIESESDEKPIEARQDDESSTCDDESSYSLSLSEENENDEDELDFEFEKYDLKNLPAHSCAYCGIHNPESVVNCRDCGRWFCNYSGESSGSHIINHLVLACHKQVALHKSSSLGQSVLECFNCGGKNIFLLGFIPAKSDSIVVLLCREPCLSLNSLKEMNWDLTQWVPLIKDRMFLPWLVQNPHEKEINRALQINLTQIRKLENLWKSGLVSSTVLDIDCQEDNETFEPVLVRYAFPEQYYSINTALVKLESDFEQQCVESMAQKGVPIRWGETDSHLYFRMSQDTVQKVRVAVGDEVTVSYPGDVVNRKWKRRGIIRKQTTNGEFLVELERSLGTLSKQKFGFNIDFVFKAVPYNRMKRALFDFVNDENSITAYLFHLLMGNEIEPQTINVDIPDDLSVPGLPKLNSSQIAAVKNSLEQPLSLIQGPPGTGKTVTSASLVYHMAQQKHGQILVCAPSNISVDHLTHKIHLTGLKVVRLASYGQQKLDSFVDFLYLNTLVEQVAKEDDNELERLMKLKNLEGYLTKSEQSMYEKLISATENDLLESADVICTTCVGARDARLRNIRFKQVIIDECTQASEPMALIPMTKGAKQVVLVGDHCQLGPVIIDSKAIKAGFQRSLFERLIMLGIRPVRLQVQYRMHPCLSEFPSNTFYEGSLQNGVTAEERKQEKGEDFCWPDINRPMFFYVTVGQEEFSASGLSYLNRLEAINVEKIVTKLLNCGVSPKQIGVITPYQGQRQYVSENMLRTGSLNKNLYEEIEVASVDGFQGREKDYIILSCVRSNENLGIGFLKDPRRLNVALTRARLGLIIVGNVKVLSTQPLWHSLIYHFKKNRLLVEGYLNDLKVSFMRLSEPTDSYEKRKLYSERNLEEEAEYSRNALSNDLVQNKALPNTLPTQMVYMHPGEIGNRNSFRPPVVNRKTRQSEGFPQEAAAPEGLVPQSQYSALDTATEDEADHGRLTFGTAGSSFFSQHATSTQMGGLDSEEFTQHLHSQLTGKNTQSESQLDSEFNNLSITGYSQELNELTETDLETDEET